MTLMVNAAFVPDYPATKAKIGSHNIARKIRMILSNRWFVSRITTRVPGAQIRAAFGR